MLTEAHLVYTSAGSSVASFRFGLTDEALSGVTGVRFLVDVPDGDGAGVISKTFPSGLVIQPGEHFPERNKIGLESFNARVRHLSASGYVMACQALGGFVADSFQQQR